MELNVAVVEYVEGTKRMTEQFKKKFGEMVFEEEFDPEYLELFQNLFKMVEASNNLIQAQAMTIHEINKKLDRLLETKQRAGA